MAAPLIGESGPFGALTVFSRRKDAWGETDAELLVAIADQAAITITTTRLIAELGESREALGRRAQAEQALREIAARITVLRDTTEILRDVVDQAVRLVRADGVILDLLDPTTGHLHWALDSGVRDQFTDEERSKLWIDIGVGATGTAVAEDRVVLAFGDLVDQFPPSPESTEFYERTGFRSMIAAPITGEAGPLGVIEVYSKRLGAFTPTDAGLVGALASQAAIAITNARLIDELGRSRAQLAQTADAERTLREIAGRVSAMRDQGEILQSVIDASARLLQASGVTIDLIGGQGMAEAWIDPVVRARTEANLDLLDSVQINPDVGVSGLAIRTRTTARDRRVPRGPAVRAHARSRRVRPRVGDPLRAGRAADPPRRRLRRHQRLLGPGRRLRRHRRRPPRRAGRPGRHRDRQRPPHRGAAAVPDGDRPTGRFRADAARDRGPRLGHPRARRGPPADHRGGRPPPRVRRRPDRPVRPGDRRAALVVRRGRRDVEDAEMGQDRWPQARPGRGRDGLQGPARGAHDRLPGRRPVRPLEGDRRVHQADAHPRGDVDAAHGRGRPDRHDLGRVAQPRPLRRVGPRGPDRARDAGVGRDPQRAAHGPARASRAR